MFGRIRPELSVEETVEARKTFDPASVSADEMARREQVIAERHDTFARVMGQVIASEARAKAARGTT